jgi:anthranilate/para-aminobenzoate synthase component II
MKSLYLCDFNDSFTYNILSVLKEYYPKVDVQIVAEENLDGLFQVIINENESCGIILGPGPGHPFRYEHLFNSLQVIFAKPNIFVMGVCLGHQLYWLLNGFSVEHCQRPSHGQIVSYDLSNSIMNKLSLPNKIEVQRYNSLAVKADPTSQEKF